MPINGHVRLTRHITLPSIIIFPQNQICFFQVLLNCTIFPIYSPKAVTLSNLNPKPLRKMHKMGYISVCVFALISSTQNPQAFLFFIINVNMNFAKTISARFLILALNILGPKYQKSPAMKAFVVETDQVTTLVGYGNRSSNCWTV